MENQAASTDELYIGKVVFFSHAIEYWDKPYVMKSHHVYSVKSVTLRGEVVSIDGNEFKAKLIDNNNFEKDGWSFVFRKGQLLSDQNYTDFASLGVWSYDDSSNYDLK
jgi:hypothetical protein